MPTTLGDLLQIRWQALRADKPAQAANRALYDCLRESILDGSLPAGTQLPPTRELAVVLDLSRNTTTHAYNQLLAEGYVRSLTGSGTYVNDVLPEQVLWTHPQRKFEAVRGAPDPLVRLSLRGSTLLENAQASSVQWGAFMPGVPDVTEFPHRKFQQLAARWRGRVPPQWLSYATGGGHPALRQAIAHHLRQARSVNCDASQVLITSGVHQAVDLVTRLLTDPGDRVWLEDPGYWGLRGVLAVNGLQVVPAAVDSEGMHPPTVAPCEAPRLIFVTPSHQYPLGAVMSLRRRAALLDYARHHGSWIVEDDYDSEFRFAGHPIASLQGLVDDAPVIYVGTFSKTLYPGLRIAYAVLPKSLVEPMRTAHAELYREGHLVTQAALADFIDQGHYAAHIRRMRLIYAGRRNALLGLVQRWLGPQWVHPFDSPAGLHVVLQLPAGMNDVSVAKAAAAQGVHVRPLSRYYASQQAVSGLLLGFACVPESEMLRPFETLVRCIERVHNEKNAP
ncbi:PLP-dependent aminotransferase family protein [bacterium BD-1]|nr:PLP-dependent aminotransferase family protein [Ottowia caeni]